MLKSWQPDDPQARKQFIDEQATARAARQRAQRLEAAAVLLGAAIRAVELTGLETASLRSVLSSLEDHLATYGRSGGGRVVPRSRPAVQKEWRREGPRNRCLLFVDESGGSRLNLNPDSPYFAVGGLLMSEPAYQEAAARWQAWKIDWIGRENARMHARELSRKNIPYYIKERARADEALRSLDALIEKLDFTLFVVAIDKAAFQRQYLANAAGSLLPGSHYGICLDFLLERVVYCLLARNDAHAHVLAETRNRMEDAKLQMEYQRLQLEGTLFHADTWFRYQLGPHITFHGKDDNVAGLQLVDVLLKAVVDKLARPESDPPRWAVARKKLYDGDKGRVRGWGLKVFPHDEERVNAVLETREETGGDP